MHKSSAIVTQQIRQLDLFKLTVSATVNSSNALNIQEQIHKSDTFYLSWFLFSSNEDMSMHLSCLLIYYPCSLPFLTSHLTVLNCRWKCQTPVCTNAKFHRKCEIFGTMFNWELMVRMYDISQDVFFSFLSKCRYII